MQRRDRWENREILKDEANRQGSLASTHPQARRGIEEAMDQESEQKRRVRCEYDECQDAAEFNYSTDDARATRDVLALCGRHALELRVIFTERDISAEAAFLEQCCMIDERIAARYRPKGGER